MIADAGASPTAGMFRTYAAAEIDGALALHARTIDAIVDAVDAIAGPDAAHVLRSEGLGALHTVLDARDVTALRDRVLDALRDDLLRLAVAVGRGALGWDGEFYVDDYLILRVNVPYDVARDADPGAENPGVGRLSPPVRAAAAARRVKDPLYDPSGYHRGHPPAAWAHGPHVDSWTGHSTGGVNVWWAISDVPAEAGMVLYPGLNAGNVACDPRTLYARAGTPLPAPATIPLPAGTMLIFDPEILHGTHLNVSSSTRVAISMRLNAHEPRFDPDCFYAREFWRRASAIERGDDTVLHLRREEHFAERSRSSPPVPPEQRTVRAAHAADGSLVVPAAYVPRDGDPVVVEDGSRRIAVVRSASAAYAFDAACPHYGIDLTSGATDGATIHCPGCALRFDLASGASASPLLRMRTYAVRDAGDVLLIDAR